MSYSFDVCLAKDKSFKENTNKLVSEVHAYNAISNMVGSSLEQACDTDPISIGQKSLVDLARYSFNDHRRLILDPDTIWVTIEQGLAEHIKQNAEALRKQFVDFEGKTTIMIHRDHFVKGGKNDWEGCFDEFSDKIGEFIGKKKDLIVSDFSTTSKLARVSSEIVLMDAMSEYFDYATMTMCGIPSVTLEGTIEDWENIRERVQNIIEFDLQWWTVALLPVLDEFVNAAKGNPDISFWQEWYSVGGGSGGPFISGHVTKFYPYIGSSKKRNDFESTPRAFGGITMSSFPKGLSSVPFIWNYHGTKYPMQFLGGIIGIRGDDNGGVRCAFGWGLRDAGVHLKNYPKDMWQIDMPVCLDNKNGLMKDADFTEYGEPGERGYSKRVESVTILWEGSDEPEVIYSHDSKYKKLIVKESVIDDSKGNL